MMYDLKRKFEEKIPIALDPSIDVKTEGEK
jgi:hypothetical protein